MDITGKIKTAVSRHGVRQHTFTFTMEEPIDTDFDLSACSSTQTLAVMPSRDFT